MSGAHHHHHPVVCQQGDVLDADFKESTPWLRLQSCSASVRRLTAQIQAAALPLEAGDFVAEVLRLKDLAFESGSGLYVAPSAQEQSDFRALADTLWTGDTNGAQLLAGGLGYEVVEFVDNVSGAAYGGVNCFL